MHGVIEVMNGGRVSVNYDNYGRSFLTGASVNGQLILNGGCDYGKFTDLFKYKFPGKWFRSTP